MNVYLLQIVNGVGIGMLYFLLAVGLSIIFGLLRFVNFAHGAFYLLGAYFCYQAMQWSLNFWTALVLVPLVVGVLAWLAEKLVLRHMYQQEHEFHIVATVGLALVIQECAILIWGPIGASVPPPDILSGVVIWGSFIYPEYRLFVIGVTAVLAVGLWWLLEGTRLGSAVRAGSESTEMVELLGINVLRVFSLVFALGAGTAALAGVLAAPLRGVDPFMGIEALSIAFVVVVVGGMGSFFGALIGGLLVGIVQSLMSTIWPGGAQLMIYVAMAAVLLLRPNGLLGESLLSAVLERYRYMLLACLVLAILPLTMRSGSLATDVLVFSLAALGCNLLLGHTGLLSFGQGIFFGLGSYTGALALTVAGLPTLPALAAATVVAALGAALVGWFSIRQRGTYFVMLTLAFAQMFYFLAYTTPQVTGGDNGLLDIPRPALTLFGKTLVPLASPWQYYGFVAALFLLVFWLLLRLSQSVFGRTLLAIRDNEARAAAVGYDVKRFKLAAFVVSGAVTGLAGALHAMTTGIAPLSNIDYHTSETILVMTVIGGTGNLFASVLGAAFYVLFADWLSTLWPRWLLLLGLLLIAISLFMQRGIWGLGERLARAAWRKRT